jgi:hypothetical protein
MKSFGKLIYSPYSHLGSNKNWLVLMADDEISRYYRFLYSKQYPYINSDYSNKLTRPVWGAHISIIRGEKIPNMNLWGIDANKIIEFEYEGGAKDNKTYFWLKVKCLYVEDLREKYGLPRCGKHGLHMTIGLSSKT